MIRIGNALVSLERREVLLDGKPMLLGGRAFEVLATLIRAKGRVVDKEELFSQVWAGTVVEDNNLQVQVSLLRKAFGDRTSAWLPVGGRDQLRGPRPGIGGFAVVRRRRHSGAIRRKCGCASAGG